MTSALIDRLTTELGWPCIRAADDLDAHLAGPGVHCLFVPGDPAKNLESNDVAVILPELASAFPDGFGCIVIGAEIERMVRDRFDVWPTPSLIFVCAGVMMGAIPKVRDWDDYVNRTRLILAGEVLAAE